MDFFEGNGANFGVEFSMVDKLIVASQSHKGSQNKRDSFEKSHDLEGNLIRPDSLARVCVFNDENEVNHVTGELNNQVVEFFKPRYH